MNASLYDVRAATGAAARPDHDGPRGAALGRVRRAPVGGGAAAVQCPALLCSALLQQRPRFASLQCLFHSENNELRLWTANEATTIDKEVQGLNNIFDAEKLEKTPE